VGVRFVDPVRRDDAARLRRFVDEAVLELGVELDVPLHLRDRHPSTHGATLPPGVHGIAFRDRIVLSRDLLEGSDDELRAVVLHEVAHLWQLRINPRVAASDLHCELFAVWFTGHVCGVVFYPDAIDTATDRCRLGRACGAALAGACEAREMLTAAKYDDLVRLVDRLDGDAHPQELAAQLVAALDGR
jgi:hypothetical protein